MNQPAPPKLDYEPETSLNDESQAFLSRHAQRNYLLYMLTILITWAASSFGDMTVFVPTLAMKLHAPSWVITFPMVAGMSIAYVPTLLVAWLMGPRVSRINAYAGSVALMYVPILVLALFLFRGGTDQLLVTVFTASIVLWSLAMGLSILPCWDLFARIFPETRRGKIMGQSQALGQFARLLSAGIAAWLISTKSPLRYPINYAAAMLIFAIGGLISAGVILLMKEYIPPVTRETETSHRSLGLFLQSIANILRSDRRWLKSVALVALSYTMAAVFPVVLTYAQKYRGFSGPNDAAWFIGVRPYIAIPFMLLCAYLANRIGPARVSAVLCALMALGIPCTLLLWGRWQFVSLFMILLGETMQLFAILVVMQRVPERLMHQYLAIFFTACIVPGLVPLGLAKLSDDLPNVVMVVIMLTSTAVAIGFFLLGRGASELEPKVPATAAIHT